MGADGDAVLRRIVPIYDPVAAEQEALDICKVIPLAVSYGRHVRVLLRQSCDDMFVGVLGGTASSLSASGSAALGTLTSVLTMPSWLCILCILQQASLDSVPMDNNLILLV